MNEQNEVVGVSFDLTQTIDSLHENTTAIAFSDKYFASLCEWCDSEAGVL